MFRIFKSEISLSLISCILFFVLAICTSFKLLLAEGTIIHHDWSIPPYREQISIWVSEAIYAWKNFSCGMASFDFSPLGTIGLIIGIFSHILGIDGSIITKGIIITSLWFSGLLTYYLCRFFKKSFSTSFIVGIFYMFTPWFFDRIVAGDLNGIISYVLLPLIVLFFAKITYTRRILAKIIYTILISLLTYLVNLVAFTLLFVPLILYSVVNIVYSDDPKKRLSSNVKTLAMIFAIRGYWIIFPFIQVGFGSTGILFNLEDLIWRSQNAQIINVIRLLGFVMSWFSPAIEKSSYYFVWIFASFFVPIIVFTGIITSSKDEYVVFAMLLAIVSIFLGKGINPPAGQIYLWAYKNVPYFQMYRDPNKWVMLLCLSYALLFSITVDLIVKFILYVRPTLRIKLSKTYLLRSLFSILLILIIFADFIFSLPFFTGDFGGNLKAVNFPNDYYLVIKWLLNQSEDFRVLWLPPDPYTQYDWFDRSYQQGDLIARFSTKPNFLSLGNDEAGRFSYFVISVLHHNLTKYIGKLLAIAGVKYIIMRNDAEGWWWSHLPEPYTRDKLKRVLEQQQGIKLIKKFGTLDIYQNDFYIPNKIVATNTNILIAGGLTSLISLSYLENFNFTNMSVLFADQLSQKDLRRTLNYITDIIIINNNIEDIIFSFVPDCFKFNCAQYATEGNMQLGWSSLSLYWWYYWFYLDSVIEPAITCANATLSIPFYIQEEGEYEVWIKTFIGTKGSHLDILIDKIEIGNVYTKALNNIGYFWIRLNSTFLNRGAHIIHINSDGRGINIITKIAIIPSNKLKEAINYTIDMLRSKNVWFLFEAERIPINSEYDVGNSFVWHFTNATNWAFGAHECNYTIEFSSDGMKIISFFNGSADEDEYVAIAREIGPIDLKKYSYIELIYSVEDPRVQVIQVAFTLDFDGDGLADAYCPGTFDFPASTELKTFTFNAYELARQFFPNRKYYNLIELKILPHKLWGVDCSKEPQKYFYLVNNIRIFGFNFNIIEDFPEASCGLAMESNLFSKFLFNVNLSFIRMKDVDIYLRVNSYDSQNLLIKIDEQLFDIKLIPLNGYRWYNVKVNSPFSQSRILLTTDSHVSIDIILLKLNAQQNSFLGNIDLVYKKVSPTKYIILINKSESAFLVFADSFNYGWKVVVDGRIIDPLPDFLFLNGFVLDNIDSPIVILEFKYQNFYEIGLIIFFVIILIQVGICVYYFRRNSVKLRLNFG